MTDNNEQLRKAILLLDCAVPYFERAAQAEIRKHEREGGLREITCQQRLESVRKMIRDVGPQVGYFE